MAYNPALATSTRDGLLSHSDKTKLDALLPGPPRFEGLVTWLRSDLGVTVDGSNNVTDWADQSGAGLIASYQPGLPGGGGGYDKPVYSASGGPNNVPQLHFTPYSGLYNATTLLADGTARTVVAVFEGSGGGGTFFTNGRGGGAFCAQIYTSGPTYFYSDGATLNIESNGGVSASLRDDYTKPSVACFTTQGVGDLIGVRLNGKACPTDGNLVKNDPATGNPGTVIGAREYGGLAQGLDGYLYELLVYDRELSFNEIQQVHAYIALRYGIVSTVEDTMQFQNVDIWEGRSPKVGSGTATMRMYLPSPTVGVPGYRPCILFCPGGGYASVVESIARDFCSWAASLGYVGAVLVYRLPDGGLSIPGTVCVDDAKRAMRLLRSGAAGFLKATAWGIDPNRIILAGESAGGHLASYVAAVSDAGSSGDSDFVERVSSKPNASFLCYPMTMLSGPYRYIGGADQFLGSTSTTDYDTPGLVDSTTCPALISWADDDGTVDPMNSNLLLQAHYAKGVGDTDFLEFATGNHGLGMVGSPQGVALKQALRTWINRVVPMQPGLTRFGRQLAAKPAQRLSGRASISVAGGSNITLTYEQAAAAILEFTGALTANITVSVPMGENGGELALANLTTGAFTLTIKVTGQTGFAIGQGKRCKAYFNATDIVRLTADV